MKNIPVYTIEGEIVEQESISEDILKEPINRNVLYYYIVSYQANQRKGSASTKTRADVSGGGRKPWRQKGTGRARVGSIRNPIWRHGGVAFGPKPKDYSINLPKKIKRKALKESIRDKFIEDKVAILKIENVELPKTKIFAGFIKKAGIDNEKILFVVMNGEKNDDAKRNLLKSLRNLRLTEYDYSNQLNAYEILKSDRLIVINDAFSDIKNLVTQK